MSYEPPEAPAPGSRPEEEEEAPGGEPRERPYQRSDFLRDLRKVSRRLPDSKQTEPRSPDHRA